MEMIRPFDVAEFLEDPKTAAAYLAAVFEEGDAEEIRVALNDVARAHGITDLSRETGLSRETLYKAFGSTGNPTLSTLLAVVKALGIKLSVAA
ncbi:putative addiction module antidote protein [Asticcacaulis sp. BYS171W]|uniref:Addiction module antidote protein n=1 Tax=Asticcacaulis aquaticus TaxID=2984212 RepID=A0ABT5HT79_9CAUL|nr:addiction module antidote protein [Asticcacaulis aquaticus]MDC7683262.1 putative addiction module antidote protein [Asticcacaulis aquaticus]